MRSFTSVETQSANILAREDLYFFSRWMFLQRRRYRWQKAGHHQIIADALTRVFNGECKRLIINIPPRYSKTELAVVNFIAWALGKAPDAEFIHTSYSGALAINNSANIRALMQHEAYRGVFPWCELATEAKAHWSTSAGGVMYATGAGGTITGFGAGKQRGGFGGAIIIDDPHKPDEVRSGIMRGAVLDWFQNTLESRKNSRETPIILIMQRLHERDLSGWLLAGGNGEVWEHICLPVITGDNTALWPEKHNIDELRIMSQASPYTFAGQYLQRPSPPEGGVFKPDQIPTIDAIPAGVTIKWVRGWDLASTTTGDYSVGAKLGKLSDGRFVIGDMVRLRCGPDERDAAILNTAKRDGVHTCVGIPQDPGQAGKTQVLYLARSLAGYNVKSSPESGDKVTRAEPLAAQINVGNIAMLRGVWNDELMDEMRTFPNGSNDDQIDALSRAFAELMVEEGIFSQSDMY